MKTLSITRAPNATYQVSRSSAFWFRGRRFFTIHGRGGHLGHVTWTVLTNFRSPIPWRLDMKFDFGKAVFEEKKFKECGRRRTTDDDDGRTTEPAYTAISSLMSLKAQVS